MTRRQRAARMERLRTRVQELPRAELERRLLAILGWILDPEADTNGGDLVDFLGGLLRDLL